RLALEDELDLIADGSTAGRPIRIGYHVVVAGPPRSQAILAAPQLLDDEEVRQEQEDLALVLVLLIGVGLVAAVSLAGWAARGLARPVAALREAAAAVGRGTPLPPFPPGAPREFEPVIIAFERMAADVRSSQAALEEARGRPRGGRTRSSRGPSSHARRAATGSPCGTPCAISSPAVPPTSRSVSSRSGDGRSACRSLPSGRRRRGAWWRSTTRRRSPEPR